MFLFLLADRPVDEERVGHAVDTAEPLRTVLLLVLQWRRINHRVTSPAAIDQHHPLQERLHLLVCGPVVLHVQRGGQLSDHGHLPYRGLVEQTPMRWHLGHRGQHLRQQLVLQGVTAR